MLSPERQRLLDYLRRHGLRGQMIQSDTHTEEGFYALNPVLGRYTEFRIPWPDSLDYDWLCKLEAVANSADFSQRGRASYAQWLADQDV